MYSIIKNVITAGEYELSDMLKKIDTVWVQGDITDSERAELIQLAQQNANTRNSYDILAKLEELDRRLTQMETDAETPGSTYPPYVAGKWYYAGDRAAYAGGNYVCIAPEGVVCVWNPEEYPQYWQLCEDAEDGT